MIKIGLHAGHTISGAGTGACGYVTEHAENRVILEYLKKELNRYKNVRWFDNTNDHAKSVVSNLKQICSNSNAQHVDLEISLHLNASANPKARGVECWIYPGSSSKKIASRICTKVSKALKTRNRGVKTSDGLYILKHTNAPCVLVECYFCTNKDDCRNIERNVKVAKAIAQAIKEVYKLV